MPSTGPETVKENANKENEVEACRCCVLSGTTGTYWLEGNPTYTKRVHHILSKMEERHDQLCTSVFTVAEVLVGPYKAGNIGTVKRIRKAFDSPFIEILPFNLATADRCAQIRAQYGVAGADAIHLACAAQSGIDLFLTNDAALPGKVISGIQFIAKLDTNLF